MINDISEEKTHILELEQNVALSPKSKVVLGLFEDIPDRDALMEALDIDMSEVWEESELPQE